MTFPGGRGSVRAGQTSGRIEGGVMRPSAVMRPAPSAGASGGRGRRPSRIFRLGRSLALPIPSKGLRLLVCLSTGRSQ
jgi:hypothetical protein